MGAAVGAYLYLQEELKLVSLKPPGNEDSEYVF